MQSYHAAHNCSWPMLDGEFVLHSDAQAEITRLTAKLRDARKVHDQIIGERYNNLVRAEKAEAERDQALARAEKAEIDAEFFKSEVKLRNRIESTDNTAASLQRKYEEALARAAAAAMDMRERAAAVSGHYMSDEADELLLDMWREDIRILPIDPDAQKALDKLLTEAEQRGYASAMDAERKEAGMSEWRDIETAPTGRKMFVVRGFNVKGVASGPYTSDPYCVWRDGDKFARWPHSFQPTHWTPLPEPPETSEESLTPHQVMTVVAKLEAENQRLREDAIREAAEKAEKFTECCQSCAGVGSIILALLNNGGRK